MPSNINLYNPALRMKRHYVTGTSLTIGALVIALGVAGAYAYQQVRIAALTRQAAAVEATLKDRQDELALLTQDVKRMKPRRKTVQELATAEALLRGHQQVAAAVDAGLIGTTEGFSDVLRAFARHTAPGVWLTTLTIDASGGEMSISGRTLDPDLLPHYIKRLNEEPVMHGRSVASLELERPENEKPYHEFTLRVDARDEIEVAADGTAPDGTAFDRATPGRARPQGAASEGVPPSGTESVTAGSAATATGGSIR